MCGNCAGEVVVGRLVAVKGNEEMITRVMCTMGKQTVPTAKTMTALQCTAGGKKKLNGA